jgi:general secretion pathway protein M
MNRFRLWWEARAAREQVMLAIGAMIGTVLIIYVGIIAPLNSTVSDLQAAVKQQQTLVQWLSPRVAVLQRLAGQTGITQPVTTANLLATIDTRLKQSEFARSVTEISQSDANSVRVSFNAVSFDDLMLWLAQQWQQSRIAVVQIDVQKTKDIGVAKVIVTLGIPQTITAGLI